MVNRFLTFAPALLLAFSGAVAQDNVLPIDPVHSTVTVRAYKSGLFSFAAHNHEVSAQIAQGQVISGENAGVRVLLNVRDMKVLDPKLDADDRAEVQKTMLSDKVLDGERFPTIEFTSSEVKTLGEGRFRVTGNLKLHGTERQIQFQVQRKGDRYSGSVGIKQSEYGIPKISIAAGSVTVKDKVDIDFEIAVAGVGGQP